MKKKFYRDLYNKSLNIVVLGGRGSGKSCFSFYIAELIDEHTDRQVKTFKFPKPRELPDFIENIDSLEDIENGDFIIFEEAGIEFDQFSYREKNTRDIAKLMKVARHKNCSLLFITQSGKTLSADIRRLTDTWILRKPTLQQLYEEINLVKNFYANCVERFKRSKNPHKLAYVIHDMYEFMIDDVELPSFWDDKLSRAYDGDVEEKPGKNDVYKMIINKFTKKGSFLRGVLEEVNFDDKKDKCKKLLS